MEKEGERCEGEEGGGEVTQTLVSARKEESQLFHRISLQEATERTHTPLTKQTENTHV